MEVEALRLRTVPLICYLSGRPQAVGVLARSRPTTRQASMSDCGESCLSNDPLAPKADICGEGDER